MTFKLYLLTNSALSRCSVHLAEVASSVSSNGTDTIYILFSLCFILLNFPEFSLKLSELVFFCCCFFF